MNCPVCNRDNTFNLSICPSCGAMMNDSVRAELLCKVATGKPVKKIENNEFAGNSSGSGDLRLPPAAILEKANPFPPAAPETVKKVSITFDKSTTADIGTKATSPTLVEFHSKNSTVPEWRLQLQNAVRKRGDKNVLPPAAPVKTAAAAAAPARQTKLATSGANALKTTVAEDRKPLPSKNSTLDSALARIEKSRQKFLVEETGAEMAIAPTAAPAPRPANKNFPFHIAPKQAEPETTIVERTAPANFAEKPKLAAPVRNESGDLDTNKLPPLPAPAKIPVAFTAAVVEAAPPREVIKVEKQEATVKSVEPEQTIAAEEHFEEFEDGAPFAMRFNAGFFDLIIGGFTSLLLLAPFMITGGDWLTFTGLLAFLATLSIVMFVYLTTTIGFYGRTFGMRIFSLEVVDINGENYPTLHQAAVSSAVYILSLVFGGAGFLTMLFNRDKRAAHDLISGTMVVKEN